VLAALIFAGHSNAQTVNPSDLGKIKLGEVVDLKALAKTPVDTICVLRPYQTALLETKGPIAERVNEHLARKHYVDDDGLWALVFAGSDTVSVQTFTSSAELRLCGGLRLASREFREMECTAATEARMARAERLGHLCLLFGQTP
jgi:hypothetical protein